jgi:hypothetical protein
MPITQYPAIGAQGPVESEDPMTALARLLGISPDAVTAGNIPAAQTSVGRLGAQPVRNTYAFAGQNGAPDVSGGFTGLTQGEMESPFEKEQARKTALDEATSRAHAQKMQDLEDFFAPRAQERGAQEQANKVALAQAGPSIAAKGTMDVERMKLEGEKYKADQLLKAAEEKNKKGVPGGPWVPGSGKTEDLYSQLDREMAGSGATPNEKPLGQLEQRAETSWREAKPIVEGLDTLLNTPESPADAGSIANHMAYAAYKAGMDPETILKWVPGITAKTQKKLQLAGLGRVVGASSYVVGSRSYEFMKQAMEHMMNPAASDEFNRSQLNEIKQLWPQMQYELIKAHRYPGSPIQFATPKTSTPAPGGGYLSTDENFGAKR